MKLGKPHSDQSPKFANQFDQENLAIWAIIMAYGLLLVSTQPPQQLVQAENIVFLPSIWYEKGPV